MRISLLTGPFIILFTFVICCNIPGNKSERSHSAIKIKTDSAQLTPQPDSAALGFEPDTFRMSNPIYPVYELSPKTTAFVIAFFEDGLQKTFVDSIFDQIQSTDSIYDYTFGGQPKNASYYDTSGPYQLIKNAKFERRLRPYFDTEYFVYGTDGVAKTTVTNIVLGIDQCKTNIFTFCIDQSTIRNIGHPLICSQKPLDLAYGSSYKHIERYTEQLMREMRSDYWDSMKPTVYGHVNNLYFSYNDDFTWGHNPSHRRCLFPERSIWILDKDQQLNLYWTDVLDLFGIPCD